MTPSPTRTHALARWALALAAVDRIAAEIDRLQAQTVQRGEEGR